MNEQMEINMLERRVYSMKRMNHGLGIDCIVGKD